MNTDEHRLNLCGFALFADASSFLCTSCVFVEKFCPTFSTAGLFPLGEKGLSETVRADIIARTSRFVFAF